ncbi:MAG TPA: PHP domain-containing protein [Acidimicrobiia bacterium]|nr:PHP domain-containing protein [Acidimicrobiia bacterium]
MAVDLHTHSRVSDGSETPTRVVELAAAAGLEAVALTDHDVLEGLTEARSAGERFGIEVIPGVELSLDWSEMLPDADVRGGMHLVVLWIDDVAGPLQDTLEDLRLGRDDRNHTIVERLLQLGLDVTMEEVAARAGTGSVGRPHIAGVMVDRGYVPDIGSAFEQYLGNGAPAYVGRRRLTPPVALELARASGGVPILAHPYTLGFDDDASLERTLERLREMGLVGVESHHSGTEPERRRVVRRMAARLDLLPSGGSDFHGSYKPGIEVGRGCGDLEVPSGFLAALREQRRRVA